MGKKVIIIGGGVAGMQTAITLSKLGISPVIIEREETIGGKLNRWDRLFPTMSPASEVLGSLREQVDASGAEILTSREVKEIGQEGKNVTLNDGTRLRSDAVVVTSGFDLFPAELKAEYGYKIYDNVNTKVNQRHCSRVCCITGVKQAIEMKQAIPDAEVYSFYMDMRMFGPGYEELYRQAQQEFNIHFIRGRISEASQTIDNRVQIKAEDTLIGLPLKMTVDMLVLIVGMKAGACNLQWSRCNGVDLYPSGFVKPKDQFTGSVDSGSPHIFYAGTITAPKNIGESINEAVAAAHRVAESLKE